MTGRTLDWALNMRCFSDVIVKKNAYAGFGISESRY